MRGEGDTDVKSDAPSKPTEGFWVLLVAILGSSMAFIDATAVNVALPSMQRSLHADAANLQWIVEGYSLFLSALILIGGSLADIFGRRRIFITGIVLFTVASIACACAANIFVLNLARALQGTAAALSTPGSLALISAYFKGTERGRAIGTWSGAGAMTAAIGPLLGGWLAQHASWRYVFMINAPLGIAVTAASLLYVTESYGTNKTRSVDGGGAALATMGLGLLTYGLIRFPSAGWDSESVSLLVISIVLSIGFLAWEHRATSPMIPLSIFQNMLFRSTNIYTFFLYAALGGSLFFVPFDLQNVQGYSPSQAGGAMLPFVIIMFLSSRWSGGLVGKIGPRIPLIVGASIAGLGFLSYARIGIGGSYWTTFFPAAVVLGIGGAFFIAPLTTTVMNALDTSHAGIASGINNAVARIAGLLAIAALGIALITTLTKTFDQSVHQANFSAQTRQTIAREHDSIGTGKIPDGLPAVDRARVQKMLRLAYAAGFTRTMLISACLSWAAALVAFLAIRAPLPEKMLRQL